MKDMKDWAIMTPKQLAERIRSGAFGGSDKLIEYVYELRGRADRCEREFITFLRALEISDIWRTIGDAGTFVKFLDCTIHCNPQRYMQGVRAIELFDIEQIKPVGMGASKLVARVEEKERRDRIMAALVEKAEARGYPVSEREAKEFIQPHPLDRPKPINPLKAENEQLRQVIECLKAEVRRLGGDPDSVIARAQERRENGGRGSKGRSARKDRQNPEARV